jgi:hypothetical protein
VGPAIDGDTAWLRISSLDAGYAFHSSRDGTGCEVVFDQVRLEEGRPAHLFDGA